MPTVTSSRTYGSTAFLIDQICAQTGENISSSRARPKVLNYLNLRYRHIIAGRNWRFLHRDKMMDLLGAYTTGTVSVDKGTTVVDGVGTAFPTIPSNYEVLDVKFKIDGGKTTYNCERVSGTELALTSLFNELSVADANYQIYYPKYIVQDSVDAITGAYVGGVNPQGQELDVIGVDAFRTMQKTYIKEVGCPRFLTAYSAVNLLGDNYWFIEVWPAPEEATTLLLSYDILPPALIDADTNFSLIPAKYMHVLQLAVIADMLADQKYLQEAKSAAADYKDAYKVMASDTELSDDRARIKPAKDYYREARYSRRATRRGRY